MKLNLPFDHSVLKTRHHADAGFVCLVKPAPNAGHTAYVTYRVDMNGDCYWGHYINDEQKAQHDFVSR